MNSIYFIKHTHILPYPLEDQKSISLSSCSCCSFSNLDSSTGVCSLSAYPSVPSIKLNSDNSETDSGVIVETSDTNDARLFYNVTTNNWEAGENNTYSQVITLADAVADGNASKEKVLKTSAAGLLTVTNVSLAAVGSAITTGNTSSVSVPTIGQIAVFGAKWGGSAKTVSTSAPGGGDGSDGDFWFVREA